VKARVVNRLRATFKAPLFPNNVGSGIVPWMSGDGLRTRLVFNPLRMPLAQGAQIPADIVRFAEDGRALNEWKISLSAGAVRPFDIPSDSGERLSCGYCWIRGLGRDWLPRPLQTHFQVIGPGTFAMTHGRPKGCVIFERAGVADHAIGLLDRLPYGASTVQAPADGGVRQGFLVMNVSNRRGRFRAEYDREPNEWFELPAHGSRLMFSDRPNASVAEFRGSAPFTFYTVLARPDNTGIALQHILDAF